MSTIRTPVGPQPPNVYWRRRLVVLLGLVAVIVIIILIVVGSHRGGAPTPTPPASATPTNSANPGAAGACDPTKVTVTAQTDTNDYAAAQQPKLSFALKSSQTTPCAFLAGSDVQEFRVTSGDELIWSSKDCQLNPVPATALLQPFIPLQGTTLTWDRTRSSTDTCNVPRDPVTAGGASYHLEIIVNGVASKNDPQFLLE